jgi:hypothetical protein
MGHQQNLYEQDFFAWAQQNAALLRAARVAEADLEHLAEEIEDMGKAERHALRSQLCLLLVRWPRLRTLRFQADFRPVCRRRRSRRGADLVVGPTSGLDHGSDHPADGPHSGASATARWRRSPAPTPCAGSGLTCATRCSRSRIAVGWPRQRRFLVADDTDQVLFHMQARERFQAPLGHEVTGKSGLFCTARPAWPRWSLCTGIVGKTTAPIQFLPPCGAEARYSFAVEEVSSTDGPDRCLARVPWLKLPYLARRSPS